jgi:rubrerythrin
MMEEIIKLFKKAIAGEVTASAFYSLASEVTKNDETRMVFLDLSTTEDDHAQSLVNKFIEVFSIQDFDSQAYLDDLIKKNAGVNMKESEIINNGTPQQVLELAISLENEAKGIYKQLADEAIEPALKQYSLELAAEEEKHALQLSNVLNSLGMDAADRPGL